MTKVCSKCKKDKPLAEFYANPQTKDGKGPRCKECIRDGQRKASLDPEIRARRSDYEKKWRARNSDELKARRVGREKKWRDRNSDRIRDSNYRRKYGISLAEYSRLFEAQGGVCRLCGQTCASGRRLAVDHDYQTGKVRALLCKRCNTGLGELRDSPEILERAARYVREFRDCG